MGEAAWGPGTMGGHGYESLKRARQETANRPRSTHRLGHHLAVTVNEPDHVPPLLPDVNRLQKAGATGERWCTPETPRHARFALGCARRKG